MTSQNAKTATFTNDEMHKEYPEIYPPVGTQGSVLNATIPGWYQVQWPVGAVPGKSISWVCWKNVRVEEA